MHCAFCALVFGCSGADFGDEVERLAHVPVVTSEIMPNPLISRGRPVASSEGPVSRAGDITSVNDGRYDPADGFEAEVGSGAPWIAIDLGASPARVLVSWLSEGDTDDPTAMPHDYRLETSRDGKTWTTALTITGNELNARAHGIDMLGDTWVRCAVDAGDASNRVHFIELEVHDISNGSEDTWLFLGDSITADAMSHYVLPDLATRIHEARPEHSPVILDLAIARTSTRSLLEEDSKGTSQLDQVIELFPDIRNVVVAYGTNDSTCGVRRTGVSGFRRRLSRIVTRLMNAEKRVIVPQIPWNRLPCDPALLEPYNDAIDSLRIELGFVAGPDLYSYFASHPDELGDVVHPNEAGKDAMNTLYLRTILDLYPP